MDNKVFSHDKSATKWYGKHKKALIIGGVVAVGTTAAIIAYVLLRKKMVSAKEIAEAVNVFSAESIKPISEITNNFIERARPDSPVHISSHLRKLHEGWHASESQLKLAGSLGLIVPYGHTLVSGHTRYNHLLDCA